MELTYIFLSLCIVALILLLISPKSVANHTQKSKKREIDELKFTQSEFRKRLNADQSIQYAVLRIVLALLIFILALIGIANIESEATYYLGFGIGFVVLANIVVTCGHLQGIDVLKFTKYALVGKIIGQILLAIGLSVLIANGTVSIATIMLGFIVGAVYFKLLVHKTTAVHSYFALGNSLKFSNLGLAIIALIYKVYAFPILLTIGFTLVLGGSTTYVVNKKGLELLTALLYYAGYILIALSFNFI